MTTAYELNWDDFFTTIHSSEALENVGGESANTQTEASLHSR